ncbi:hypothetical protein [Nocardia sp. NPDC056100]|uniref:TY-Chap domain-containing protein n=1 Tax=Nocardia sp. NPDC056100 TaxID=3345712 RepID=UPI0035DB0D44
MNDDFWAAVQSGMPEILWAEHDENYNLIQRWSWVRFRDTGTGSEILFFENCKVLEVAVRTPTDPVAAQQLLAVLSSNPIWTSHGQRHTASWRLLTEDEDSRHDSYYAEAAAAVANVMREGLRMDLTRMRYAVGDRSGPLGIRWTWSGFLTADRPTDRHAPEQCSDWGDFVERLDWLLLTQPWNDVSRLETPTIEFHNGMEIISIGDSLAITTIVEGIEEQQIEDLDHRLCSLGWRSDTREAGFGIWQYGPFPMHALSSDRQLRNLAEVLVTTLRDVYGVARPQDLMLATNTNYMGKELGIQSTRNWTYIG